MDEAAQNGVGGGTATDACSACARALAGKLPPQTLIGLALLFRAAAFDVVDALVAFSVDFAGLPLLRLIGKGQIEANGGETA
ncbi:MAG: hypothetical protein R3F54_15580 [Alphaproteobacteria bacterium]